MTRAPNTHKVKSWPNAFAAVLSGRKRFEVRRDDRSPSYESGDILLLHEFDPAPDPSTGDPGPRGFTGRKAMYFIGWVQRGAPNPPGFCAFDLVSIEDMNRVLLAVTEVQP